MCRRIESQMAGFLFEYVVVGITGLFALLLLFSFLFRKYLLSKSIQKSAASLLFEKERKEPAPRWYGFLFPQSEGKMKRPRSKRRHKVERQKRHDFFAGFGKEPERGNKKSVSFPKLQRIVRHHKGPPTVFNYLDEAVKAMRRKEKQLVEKKEVKIRKDDAISSLRKLVRKD